MSPARFEKMTLYFKELQKRDSPFPCPYCCTGDNDDAIVSPPPLLLPKDFERHCSQIHELNPKRCCVWCFGKMSWKTGEKNLHAQHLLTCFRKFCDRLDEEGESADDDDGGVSLVNYLKDVARRKYPFPCPVCKKSILPKNFERHCSVNHKLDPKLCCVWCRGKEKWAAGSKRRHANHLNLCFRKFYILNASPGYVGESSSSSSSGGGVGVQPKLMDMTPMCEPREFYGKEDLRGILPPEAFEEFRVLDHGNRVPYYRDENLNDAASYVRMYEQTKKTHDWIHVMVKAVTFKSFLEAVEKNSDNGYDAGKVELLPFSCWCDGGGQKEARFRHHRHMLVVSFPKGRFAKDVWPDVNPSERPKKDDGKKFLSKGMNYIQSHIHLANTIGYLCRRESRCNFKIDGKRGPVRHKHFYGTRTLPKDFLLVLSVQWDGGVMEQLYQEKLQNVSVPLLAKSDKLFLVQLRWKQKVKDFYGLKRGLVLPLRKGYLPVEGVDDDDVWIFRLEYCWLVNGKKLYFEYSEENENLDDETWLSLQVERGNCFYEAVQEETWTPRVRDQEKLSLVMPILRENEELKAENEGLRDENALLKRKREEEIDNLQKRHEKEVSDLKKGHKKELAKLKNDYKCKLRRGINSAAAGGETAVDDRKEIKANIVQVYF